MGKNKIIPIVRFLHLAQEINYIYIIQELSIRNLNTRRMKLTPREIVEYSREGKKTVAVIQITGTKITSLGKVTKEVSLLSRWIATLSSPTSNSGQLLSQRKLLVESQTGRSSFHKLLEPQLPHLPGIAPYRVVLGNVKDKLERSRRRLELLLEDVQCDSDILNYYETVDQLLEPLLLCYESLFDFDSAAPPEVQNKLGGGN